ncbi:MAG: hypothetical protein AB1468_04765 [Candidatus Micrarchaeota archaeon]
MAELSKTVEHIIQELKAREKAQDKLLVLVRELVRGCSIAIKCIHSKDMEEAERQMREVERLVKEARSLDKGFENITAIAYQEYCEAKLLLALIARRKLPGYEELGVPFEIYLLGLCDVVGELRREMLEEMKRNDSRRAEYYFERMNEIYEAMLPIRFSNSLLPQFRKKQDVARTQVEHARSELLHHIQTTRATRTTRTTRATRKTTKTKKRRR